LVFKPQFGHQVPIILTFSYFSFFSVGKINIILKNQEKRKFSFCFFQKMNDSDWFKLKPIKIELRLQNCEKLKNRTLSQILRILQRFVF
jgi:hypothetical protein